MKDQSRHHNNLGLAVATIALGLIVGLVAGFLAKVLDWTETLFLNFREDRFHPVAIMASPNRRLIAVIVGGIIAAIIWYLMQRRFRHPARVSAAVKGTAMPFWRTMVDVTTQVFYVGTGGSVGRELAPREAGAMLAQQWQRWAANHPRLAINGDDRHLLVAAAAGAGFAGVYIAPITGTMFCVEILYRKVSARVLAVALTMSSIATVIGGLIKNWDPYYEVTDKAFSLKLLPLALVIAPLLGWLGACFNQGVRFAGARRATNQNILWQLPLVATLTGLVAIPLPQIMGNGRGIAQLAMNTRAVNASVVALLLVAMFLKALVTLLTIRSGAYGGILTPSISIGACIGVLAGMLYAQLVPGISLTQCAVIGAVGFLTASQQAPLMATFMLVEVCHLNYSSLLPLALCAGISIAVGHWWLFRKIH